MVRISCGGGRSAVVGFIGIPPIVPGHCQKGGRIQRRYVEQTGPTERVPRNHPAAIWSPGAFRPAALSHLNTLEPRKPIPSSPMGSPQPPRVREPLDKPLGGRTAPIVPRRLRLVWQQDGNRQTNRQCRPPDPGRSRSRSPHRHGVGVRAKTLLQRLRSFKWDPAQCCRCALFCAFEAPSGEVESGLFIMESAGDSRLCGLSGKGGVV